MNLQTLSVVGIIVAVIALIVVGTLILTKVMNWNSTASLVISILAIALLVLSAVTLNYQQVQKKKIEKIQSESGFPSSGTKVPDLLTISDKNPQAWHSKSNNSMKNRSNVVNRALTPEQTSALQDRVQEFLKSRRTGAPMRPPTDAEKALAQEGVKSVADWFVTESKKPAPAAEQEDSISSRTRGVVKKIGSGISYVRENPEKLQQLQQFVDMAAATSNDPRVAEAAKLAKSVQQFLQVPAPTTQQQIAAPEVAPATEGVEQST